jgi:hypothetical protein
VRVGHGLVWFVSKYFPYRSSCALPVTRSGASTERRAPRIVMPKDCPEKCETVRIRQQIRRTSSHYKQMSCVKTTAELGATESHTPTSHNAVQLRGNPHLSPTVQTYPKQYLRVSRSVVKRRGNPHYRVRARAARIACRPPYQHHSYSKNEAVKQQR